MTNLEIFELVCAFLSFIALMVALVLDIKCEIAYRRTMKDLRQLWTEIDEQVGDTE